MLVKNKLNFYLIFLLNFIYLKITLVICKIKIIKKIKYYFYKFIIVKEAK